MMKKVASVVLALLVISVSSHADALENQHGILLVQLTML